MIKKVALVAVLQLALVPLAVWPQLSARATGDTYRMRVAPVDPIDPFRGAYVDLRYPDLRTMEMSDPPSLEDGDSGAVYATLVQDGEVWVLGEYTRTRPDEGPYLACDDRYWAIRCGIESWFASQDEARRLERALADNGAVATIKIDGRGNAAIVGMAPR
ncbi:MAG: GDYXXLXY domain-containing protein [Nocardioides sp.]